MKHHRLASRAAASALICCVAVVALIPPGFAAACEGGGGEEKGSVTIAPTSHNFGSVKTGLKTTEDFTVSTTFASAEINWLGSFVSISNIKNAGFTVSNNGCKEVTISPGSPCTIKVAFEPTNKVLYESILEVPWRVSGGLASGKVTSKLEGLGT